MIKLSGVIFALLAMIFWGLAPILAEIGLTEVSPYLGLSLRTFGIASILLAFGLATGRIVNLSELELKSALLLLGEGIFAGLLGHLAYFHGLKIGEASRIVPIAMAFPIVTVVVGILFLNESVSFIKLIGVSLAMGGIVLLSL